MNSIKSTLLTLDFKTRHPNTQVSMTIRQLQKQTNKQKDSAPVLFAAMVTVYKMPGSTRITFEYTLKGLYK